jgi:hypothetical protein
VEKCSNGRCWEKVFPECRSRVTLKRGRTSDTNYLHRLRDFQKDLTEDTDMGEQDIPDLVLLEKGGSRHSREGTISSFQTVVD